MDHPIRPLSPAEQAEALRQLVMQDAVQAAHRTHRTGLREVNPHAGTPLAEIWQSRYTVTLLRLSHEAEQGEASA